MKRTILRPTLHLIKHETVIEVWDSKKEKFIASIYGLDSDVGMKIVSKYPSKIETTTDKDIIDIKFETGKE